MHRDGFVQEQLPIDEVKEAEFKLAHIILELHTKLQDCFYRVHERETRLIDDLYGPPEWNAVGLYGRRSQEEKGRLYSSACEDISDILFVVPLICDGILRAKQQLNPEHSKTYNDLFIAAEDGRSALKRWSEKNTGAKVDSATRLVHDVLYSTSLSAIADRLQNLAKRILGIEVAASTISKTTA